MADVEEDIITETATFWQQQGVTLSRSEAEGIVRNMFALFEILETIVNE